jgi:hypothetical protein
MSGAAANNPLSPPVSTIKSICGKLLAANLMAFREIHRALQFRDRWIFSDLLMARTRWRRPIPLAQLSISQFAKNLCRPMFEPAMTDA